MTNLKIDPLSAQGFNLCLGSLMKSGAYAQFCERVYGRDLLQFNALDEEQLQFLILNMKHLRPGSILDLGCGTGRITEYLSGFSDARILGVDFADQMIYSAKERSINNPNLSFEVCDLNQIPSSLGKFDLIVAIDTLCFVEDISAGIEGLLNHLASSGRLIVFHSYRNKSDGSRRLEPESSPVGRALTEAGFLFDVFDFTLNEKDLWQRTIKVGWEMQEIFETEGNRKVCEDRIWEAERNLEWFQQGSYRRSMFIAKRPNF